MTDLPATVGDDQLGPEEPFAGDDVPDPGDAGRPGDADGRRRADDRRRGRPTRRCASPTPRECAELPAAEAEPLFADANQLTFFTEGDVTYQVAAVQQVPGRTC